MLADDLAAAPTSAGVYTFRAADGSVLYIGKARNCRRRLASYVRHRPVRANPDLPLRLQQMIARAERVDVTECVDEAEALILEASLIGRHRPPYNIRLREGQRPTWIALTVAEEYPRLLITRERPRTGRRYYGPFASRAAAEQLSAIALARWPLRPCPGPTPYRPGTLPCLDYHLGRCGGPCAARETVVEYGAKVAAIMGFLGGGDTDIAPVRADLSARMNEASAQREYERAAALRDRLDALNTLTPHSARTNTDVLGIARNDQATAVSVVSVREGALVDRGVFVLAGIASNDEIMDMVYPGGVPRGLLSRAGVGRQPRTPRETERCERAERTAARALATHGPVTTTSAPEEIGQALGVPAPRRIEMYDIAHLHGRAVRASVVVWADGALRGHRIFSLPEGEINDPAQMAAAVRMRLTRVGGDDPLLNLAPDLICLDGGRGQLSVVTEALHDEPARPLLIALAKEYETVYHAGGTLPLMRDSMGSRLLQSLRDEAHRTSNRAHRRARDRTHDVLEDIPGIGPTRRARLRAEFGTLAALARATPAQLTSCGIPAAMHAAVRSFARTHTAHQ